VSYSNTTMKVFLSGSTSFLGSKFIELYGRDYEIFGFSQHDSNNSIDLLDEEKISTAFETFQPDAVIHLAAMVSHHGSGHAGPNVAGTQTLVNLAQRTKIPFIFMSSESVYGGADNVDRNSNITETAEFNPKHEYAESKIASEMIIQKSELPYLILRAHRFIGINKSYAKPKQFPDTLKAIERGEEVHLDAKKLFRPTFINNLADIFDHYLNHDLRKNIIFNVVIEKTVTFFELMSDVAQTLGLNRENVFPDGCEESWPVQSTLDVSKLKDSGYPHVTYEDMLIQLKMDYEQRNL